MKPLFPQPIKPGDKIAILSPASIIDPVLVERAVEEIAKAGYEPVVMPHTLGRCGSYSGTTSERLDDLVRALLDPEVRAILCSRGGYGAVHLLAELDRLPLDRDPKWIAGFSDISALHALMASHGIVSLHSSMAKGLARGVDHWLNVAFLDLLRGEKVPMEVTTELPGMCRDGVARGELRGGNLAVLDGLVGTPFNDIKPGCILVIEDIAEPVYKIERMLYRLELAGILPQLAGLVVGQFTEYTPDRNHPSMEEMIYAMTSRYDYPVAMGMPIGHVDNNYPWLHGAEARVEVAGDRIKISYL